MSRAERVIVLGLDGLDPRITESLLAAGELPSLARLRETGGYRRLGTTRPAQTPVAWSSFATSANPGGHGIYDFLTRNPATYLPEIALHTYERRGGFLPPRPVNRRGGTPVWEVLGAAGIPSIVLRHPCTYPPSKGVRGRLLAGVGVPDVRGGFGTAVVFSSAPDAVEEESERLVPIRPDGSGVARAGLVGPRGKDGDELEVQLTVHFDPAGRVRIESDGKPRMLEVAEGEWSDWLRVKFKVGALQSIRGVLRFHLVSAREPYLLYASPVNFDPEVPAHPISQPWDYAWELQREIGGYHTLGMAEDHNGLNNSRLTETVFLDQCEAVRQERIAMLEHELARHESGLLYCLFDTPDRVQHMFWRYREPEHPANREHPRDPALADTIEDEYRACDRVVGRVLDHADAGTLILVASDHGFSSFQREIHLNRWLHREGFLALTPGAVAGDGSDGLAGVDWSRTRAFAVGLAGIFLNRAGREAEGIVAAEDAAEVAAAIARGLGELQDPDTGAAAVRSVVTREEAYRGPFVENAPDLLVGTSPGYRISSTTALGGVPEALVSDNTRRWSGDHVVDPAAVPGILFSNRSIDTEDPHLTDLAPTVLHVLGAPAEPSFEGEPIIS